MDKVFQPYTRHARSLRSSRRHGLGSALPETFARATAGEVTLSNHIEQRLGSQALAAKALDPLVELGTALFVASKAQ